MEAPKLSVAERLTLANQYDILALVDEQNHSTYQQNAEILRRGYTGMYHALFDSVSEEISEDVTEEVHNILSMFRTIENSIASLPAAQQTQLDQTYLRFEGFDGNHDEHYHQASFMVRNQGLYDEYAGSNLNSHTQSSLPRYRKQFTIFQRVHKPMQNLTLTDLQQLAAA